MHLMKKVSSEIPTFNKLFEQWSWMPISNCPGRFRLNNPAELSFEDLLGANATVQSYHVPTARDEVLVCMFNDGSGLISYRRPNGQLIHTLNTIEGMARKLFQLGIK